LWSNLDGYRRVRHTGLVSSLSGNKSMHTFPSKETHFFSFCQLSLFLLSYDISLHISWESEFQGQHVTVDAFAIMRELGANIAYLVNELKLSAASTLLVHAYEATKRFQNTEPLWEFLHHCRNAGAHGGRFTFRNDQPKHPAIWGRYNLSRATHEGMPLIPHRGIRGLFAPGDPLRLLWEIERQYIVPTL